MNPARPPGEPRNGVPHDAWLRAALRHAPDADAAPPPALSEAILREARAAVRSAPPAGSPALPGLAQRLLAAWSWLARPPVAAAFASVLVATTIGVMWWDRPLDETLPPREAPAVAPAPAAAPQPAPAAPPQAKQPAPTPATPTPPRSEALARPDRAPAAKPREAPRAPVESAAPRVTEPAAPGAAATQAAPEARDESLRARAAEAPAHEAERRRAPAAPAPMAQSLARRDTTPLASLRAAIAAQPERWAWQRDGGSLGAMDTALVHWLQRVDETARGRWAAPPTRTETATLPAVAILLLHDGSPHTTLRLASAAVEVESPAAGTRQRAELPAAEATALRIELDQATR